MTPQKPIQSQIMVDKFDSQYTMEREELIFSEYNKNKFIEGQMSYVLDGNNKYNIILGGDFNV